MALTGYTEFYATRVALGSQKGNEGVHTVFNSTAQRQSRENNCTCIKEIIATTKTKYRMYENGAQIIHRKRVS